MISLDDLRGGVDRPSGTPQFALTLGAIPGLEDTGVVVFAHYGGVGASATTTNLSAPTGPLGLGWSLPLEGIVAVYPPGAATADPEYVLNLTDGSAIRLRAVSASGQQVTYATDPYQYWQVTRDLATDSWEIVREDGRRWIYGEQGSGRATIETGVRWGNFAGSSVAAGQEAFSLAWNLSRVVDLWGNTYTWTYRQVTGTVGTGAIAYTQASYFERVVGPAGDTAIFTYAPKTAAEYELPDTQPPPPNAWQYRVEREYLAEIEFRSPSDSLQVVQFDYTDDKGHASFLGSGTLTKRLLMGIGPRHRGADGTLVPATIPATRFAYSSDPAAPGYGSIASVTTAEGGVCAYAYASAVQLPLCRRDTVVQAPVISSGVGCSHPRFWFAEDYVVVLWQRSDAKAEIVAYAWEGRWVTSRPGTVAAADAAAYAAIEVATADRGFAVLAGAQCLACAYDPDAIAFTAGTALTLDLTAGEPTSMACGNGFATVLGVRSGKLNRIRWTGNGWSLDTVALGAGATTLRCALDAGDSYAISCWTDGGSAGDQLHVRIDRLLGTCAWEVHTTAVTHSSALVEGVEVYAGDTFALLLTRASAAGLASAEYRALSWSADYGTFAASLLDTLTQAAPPPAPLLQGATVAIGTLLLRYSGAQWTSHDVAPATLLALGVDEALLGSGSGAAATYSALLYDPNSTHWSAPANLDGLAPGAGEWCARAARADADGSRWLLAPATSPAANALWYLAPDGTWSTLARIPDALAAAELPSLQLLGETYCIYQAGGSTHVYLLADGAATAAPALTGEQILLAGQPPELLVGPTSFVTYTGTFGTGQSTLRLRRAIRGGVDGALTAMPLETITQTTGYQSVPGANGTLAIACAFRAANATVDPSGWWPAYNLTELAEGASGSARPLGSARASYFNGLTAAELAVAGNALVPPPASDNDASVASAPGLYRGGAYYSGAVAADGVTVPIAIALSWTALAVTAGQYAFRVPRHATVRRSADGVTQTDQSAWNAANGFVSHEQRSSYDALGVAQTMTTEYRYFSDQYGHPELNLLNVVIEETHSTNGTPTGRTIQTWKDWAAGAWSSYETYATSTAAPTPFNRWKGENVRVAAGWLLQERIAQRTVHGMPSETVDAHGLVQAAAFDVSQRVPVAGFAGAYVSTLTAGYYGVEAYESPAPWRYVGGSLAALIVADDAHTGRRCLRVPNVAAGSGHGLAATFAGAATRFVFSCWMRVPSGSNASAANARWQVFLDAASIPALTLAFPSPGAWTYVSAEIDLTQTAAAQVTILALNESNMEVYVDELRYAPQAARYAATVYDPTARRPLARIGDNGWVERDVLDPTGRVLARIGAGDMVETMMGAAFARTLAAGAFDPALPNILSTFATSGAGRWMPFGRGDAGAWTLPSSWTIGEWQLRYGATASNENPPYDGPAVLQAPALANFAARVRFERGSVLRGAGIGLDNLIVHWEQSEDAWILGYQASGGQWMSAAIRAAPFAIDWMLAVIDGRVLFWGDGNPIFAYPLTQLTPAGKLNLFAADPCAFSELALMLDPRLSLTCGDGAGQLIQQLDFVDDTTVSVSGVLTDVLRREYVKRDPVSVAVNIPPQPEFPTLPSPEQGRVDGNVTTYLSSPTSAAGAAVGAGAGSGSLTIAGYLALDPPPFEQVGYDSSPVGRVTSAAPCGVELAGAHAATFAWAAHTATDALAGLGYDGQPGQYQVQTAVDPNGVRTYTLLNAIGQTLARRVQTGGAGASATFATTQFFYDPAGRLVKTLLPNAFAGSTVDQRWAVTRTYTFLGQLANVADPDGGQVQLNYDELGRLRYRLDANGAAKAPPQIVYYLYDQLDRLVEEGTIQSTAVDFGAIPQYAPYTLPQSVTPAWTRRLSWDRNAAAPGEPNLAGRLWRVEIANPSGASDVESYSYDQRGNITAQRVAIAGYDAQTYQAEYRYDTTGALVETIYPRPLSGGVPVGEALKVGRYYDRLGRLVGVGQVSPGTEVFDPRNPVTAPGNAFAETYARFEYDATGHLAAESYDNAASAPIARAYTRDPASSLLLAIGGDYHAESLTYTSGGYDGAGYWDGTIAAAENSVSVRPGSDPFSAAPVLRGRWAYVYDNPKRLLAAQRDGEQADASLDLGTGAGTPISYDANGNLLAVPRIDAAEAYTYAPASDRLTTHAGTVALTQDFSATSAPGWSWGASNGGPSSSAVIDSGVGAGKALKLAGGGPGHVEQLAYRGYLDATGAYQLTYSVKADQELAGQAGAAGWYLQLYTAAGEALRVAISDASTATASWRTVGPLSIDAGAIAAAAGLEEPVIAAGLLLVNAKRGADGPAASLYVTGIALSGGGSRQLAYDANGNVNAAAKLGLLSVSFDPVTNRTSRIELTGAEASAIAYSFGSTGRRTLESVSYPTGAPEKTLYLRDPSGALLMRRAGSAGVERVSAYLDGASGMFAEVLADTTAYLLRDHLGSTRAVVPGGATGAPAQWLDYGPFGELRSAAPNTQPYRYAGYEEDRAVGLLDLGARLYDPQLRRFLQVDPLRVDAAGYAYAGGDPIGLVDPDGEWPQVPLAMRVAFYSSASFLASNALHSPATWLMVRRLLEWETDGIGALLTQLGTDMWQMKGEAVAGSLGYASVFWAAHGIGHALDYTVASRGSTLAGALVVASAGVAADAARRLLRMVLGSADVWADFGLTSIASTAFTSSVNFVLLGGAFPRVFPSNTAFPGAFTGWMTGSPLWSVGAVPVPPKRQGKAPNKQDRKILAAIGRSWGCHHSGLPVSNATPDHQPPNKILVKATDNQHYFPHHRSCWDIAVPHSQAHVMRQTTVSGPPGAQTFDMHGVKGVAVSHATDSMRAWRIWSPDPLVTNLVLQGTPASVATGLGLLAWQAYTSYWLYAHWGAWYKRWRG